MPLIQAHERQADFLELEARLVYKVSSQTARAMYRVLASK